MNIQSEFNSMIKHECWNIRNFLNQVEVETRGSERKRIIKLIENKKFRRYSDGYNMETFEEYKIKEKAYYQSQEDIIKLIKAQHERIL